MVEEGTPRGESVPSYLELDHVFRAIGHPRRRYLLYSLMEDTEWTLWELATKVASWEHDAPMSSLQEDEIEAVYVSLYHNHVPKLVEDNVIRFSETDERIQPGSNADQVIAVLDSAGGTTDSEQETHARGTYDEGHS